MVSAEQLKFLSPIDKADHQVLSMLAEVGDIQYLNEGETLFRCGSVDDSKIYLLDGELQLTAGDGRVRLIKSEEKKPVSQAIASLVPRQYTVTATSDTKIVRFDNAKFEQILNGEADEKLSSDEVEELLDHNVGVETDVFTQIFVDITSENFSLPSLPEVGTRALQILREDKSNAEQLETVIQSDPVIAAKIIKVANSAIYGGQSSIDSVSRAIVRIGMDTTTQMVMGFATENLFKTNSKLIKKAMREVWYHSVEVAAIAAVMAKKIKLFDPGQAMLAGLIHDIGKVAVLSYMDKNNHPVNNKQINDVLAALRSEIGSMILSKWNFPSELVNVVEGAEDWQRDHNQDADLCDLILVAQLHADIQNPAIIDVPPMFELASFKKLSLQGWSPKTGLAILQEAEQEVRDIVHMFIE